MRWLTQEYWQGQTTHSFLSTTSLDIRHCWTSFLQGQPVCSWQSQLFRLFPSSFLHSFAVAADAFAASPFCFCIELFITFFVFYPWVCLSDHFFFNPFKSYSSSLGWRQFLQLEAVSSSSTFMGFMKGLNCWRRIKLQMLHRSNFYLFLLSSLIFLHFHLFAFAVCNLRP